MELGDRISIARRRLKINQEELGKVIDRSQKTMSDIENGKVRNLQKTDINKLASHLQVSPKWVVEGTDAPQWFIENTLSVPGDADEMIMAFQNTLEVVLDTYIANNPRLPSQCRKLLINEVPVGKLGKDCFLVYMKERSGVDVTELLAHLPGFQS